MHPALGTLPLCRLQVHVSSIRDRTKEAQETVRLPASAMLRVCGDTPHVSKWLPDVVGPVAVRRPLTAGEDIFDTYRSSVHPFTAGAARSFVAFFFFRRFLVVCTGSACGGDWLTARRLFSPGK